MKRRVLTIAAGSALALGAFACAPPAGPNGQGNVTPPGSLACAPNGGTAHPVVHATDTLRPGQWAFDHYDFEAVWPRTNGAGMKVALVDNGVDGRVPDLQGQVHAGRMYQTADPAGVAFDPNPSDPNLFNQDVNPDPNGHGTEIASLIAGKANGDGMVGAAPGVQIYPALVGGPLAFAADNTARAIRWTVDVAHVDVIAEEIEHTGVWPQEEAAINYAESQGVLVVASAGPVLSTPTYPAAHDNVLAVGGMASNAELAPSSAHGSYIDVVAPSSDLLTAMQPASSQPFWSGYGGQLYGQVTGTGFAVPYVTALAAMVKSVHPTWTPLQIRARIEATALDAGSAGKDQYFGSGLIAPRAAVGC